MSFPEYPEQNQPPTYGANPPLGTDVPVQVTQPIGAQVPPAYGAQVPGAAPVYGAGAPGGIPVYPTAAPAYANYGPGRPMQPEAPRPGIVPLRPLSLGEMLHGALSAFRHNPAVAIGLPLLILAIASAIGLGLSRLFVGPIERTLNTLNYDLAAQLGPQAGITGGLLAPQLSAQFSNGIANNLISLFAAPIVGGLLAIAISRSVLGDRISAGNAWQRIRSRIPALIGWTILSALIMAAAVFLPILIITAVVVAVAQVSAAGAVILGILLGLAWAAFMLWITIRMLLIPPAIALEGRPFGESVRRGWNLSKGMFWRLLGIWLLAHLLIGAVAAIFALPFGAFSGVNAALTGTAAGAAAVGTNIGTIIAGLISTFITTILTASVVALMYLDTRMRREGLDATLRQSVTGVPVATPYYGAY